MQNLALLRSMKTGDGNHRTATYLMHTGFRQGSGGGLVHPSLGAMVASELGQPGFELPNYVAVGNAMGPGYLGPKFAPLVVNDFERGLPDLKALGGQAEVDGRVSLVEELEKSFLSDYGANSTKAHQASMTKALEGGDKEVSPKSHKERDVPIPAALDPFLREAIKGKSRGQLVFTGPKGGRLNGSNVRRAVCDALRGICDLILDGCRS